MNHPEEEFQLTIKPRPSEEISIRIPVDTLEALKSNAASRDMSLEALLKFYIGQGLRQDLARSFSRRLLEKTAQVLTQHLSSEEVSNIMKEIQSEATR